VFNVESDVDEIVVVEVKGCVVFSVVLSNVAFDVEVIIEDLVVEIEGEEVVFKDIFVEVFIG